MMTHRSSKSAKSIKRFFRIPLKYFLLIFFSISIWLAIYSVRANRVNTVISQLEDSGARLGFAYEYDGLKQKKNPSLWAPTWLRNAIGDGYFTDIATISHQSNSNASSEDLAPITMLASVTRIDLDYTSIDDISSIRGQKKLRWLDLEECKIDNEDLSTVATLPNLEILVLTRNDIDDQGTHHLSRLNKLKSLRLIETGITDNGLDSLKDLVNLERLELDNTAVTEAGVKKLLESLPKCKISWDGDSR